MTHDNVNKTLREEQYNIVYFSWCHNTPIATDEDNVSSIKEKSVSWRRYRVHEAAHLLVAGFNILVYINDYWCEDMSLWLTVPL